MGTAGRKEKKQFVQTVSRVVVDRWDLEVSYIAISYRLAVEARELGIDEWMKSGTDHAVDKGR